MIEARNRLPHPFLVHHLHIMFVLYVCTSPPPQIKLTHVCWLYLSINTHILTFSVSTTARLQTATSLNQQHISFSKCCDANRKLGLSDCQSSVLLRVLCTTWREFVYLLSPQHSHWWVSESHESARAPQRLPSFHGAPVFHRTGIVWSCKCMLQYYAE